MQPVTIDRPLTFEVLGRDEQLELPNFDLVIAGYTGRDEASVKKHIDELAAIGVPPPASVPAFYELDAALVTQSSMIQVTGTNTSGEVEPVLVRASGRLYLAVGSDHTDRDIERDSVAESKAACPKPISTMLLDLAAVESVDWDSIVGRCIIDGVEYQSGLLSALRVPTEVLSLYDTYRGTTGKPDVVMYGGTLPLVDGKFVPGTDWTMSLTLANGAVLKHAYATSVLGNSL